MPRDRRAALFVASAFLLAAALAAAILGLRGTGPHGVDDALGATARLALLFFLPAYVGGALSTIFGASLLPLAKHGRDLGLAFAAVEAVHLALVARLCMIGAAPGLSTFVFFGTAAFFVFLLTLLSINAFRQVLHPSLTRAIGRVGMNFIALAFLVDLSRSPFSGYLMHRIYYAPFLLGLMLAIFCRVSASSLKLLRRWPRFSPS
jgi:hypothetical protein